MYVCYILVLSWEVKAHVPINRFFGSVIWRVKHDSYFFSANMLREQKLRSIDFMGKDFE